MLARRLAALLVLLLVSTAWLRQDTGGERAALRATPAPAQTASITGLSAQETQDGHWVVDVRYSYGGDPVGAEISLRPLVGTGAAPVSTPSANPPRAAQRGTHDARFDLARPSATEAWDDVEVRLEALVGTQLHTLASRKLGQALRWRPPEVIAAERELAGRSPEQAVARAAELIDTGGIAQAEAMLSAVLAREPGLAQAHVEAARAALKRDPGPNGARVAEPLLGEALRLDPGSVRARTLLANVYAYQQRFAQAQSQLEAAAKADPLDLWVWTGWGQLLEMQGQLQPAVAKYRRAIALQPRNGGEVIAKKQAYARALGLLDLAGDDVALDEVHRLRVAEFGDADCARVHDSRFRLLRGQAEPQLVLARLRAVPAAACNEATVHEAEGLVAYFVAGGAPAEQAGPQLAQAKLQAPVTARLLYELAWSERGSAVLRQLLASGVAIDQKDAQNNTALTYALDTGRVEVARRLLALGARPTALVGPEDLPVALVPVFNRDAPGILLMRRSGVDYATLRYRGITAFEHARKIHDARLLEMLGPSRSPS